MTKEPSGINLRTALAREYVANDQEHLLALIIEDLAALRQAGEINGILAINLFSAPAEERQETATVLYE